MKIIFGILIGWAIAYVAAWWAVITTLWEDNPQPSRFDRWRQKRWEKRNPVREWTWNEDGTFTPGRIVE